VIFKLQSLRKLSLLDVDISDKDIPAEFWSHGLSTFKFRYGGRADPIVSLMNVITCGCPGLQILELGFNDQVEIRLLELCFACPALTTFILQGGRSNYTVEDICSSLEIASGGTGHQTLKSMRIPLPQSSSSKGAKGMSFNQAHTMASLLPNMRDIIFDLGFDNGTPGYWKILEQNRKTLHGIKLQYYATDRCLELCTILVSGRQGVCPRLVLLVSPLRCYSFHK
jgi:hypothetical protein